MTTTVRGLAAATARISSTSASAGAASCGRRRAEHARPFASCDPGFDGAAARRAAWNGRPRRVRRPAGTATPAPGRSRRCTRPRRGRCSRRPPRDVGVRRPPPRRAGSEPSSCATSGTRAEPVEHGAAVEVPHVAGPAVAEVDGVGQAADDGEPTRRGQRQHRRAVDRLVAQQHHRASRDLAGERAVLGEPSTSATAAGADSTSSKRSSVAITARRPTVDVGPRHLAALERAGRCWAADHPVRHLDVEARGTDGGGVAQAEGSSR
jgi:hypothetical protein